MDSNKHSAQFERLEVVETGRRWRWSEDEKLKIVLESLQAPRAGVIDSTRLWHIALAARGVKVSHNAVWLFLRREG